MAKALKVAAIVVGVAALAVTGVGLALGAAAFATTFGVALGTVTAALSLGAGLLSVGATLLAKKPKIGSAGSALDFIADPTAGEPYVMGRTMVGGNIVHEATWGDKNKILGLVAVLSCAGPVSALDGLYADMTAVPFSGRTATGYYAGWMEMDSQLGARPEADALVMTMDGGSMPDWGAAYKLSSLAAFGLCLKADIDESKVFASGVPKLTTLLHGVKGYDPRGDSTNGGSGAQRALNETTYVYSENPWVHHGTFALGRWVNGKRVIGPGVPTAQIDWPSHIEAANIADANGWKVSGRILSTDSKWQVLKSIAQAGGGYPIPTTSKLSCLVNAPRVSLATIQESDLRGPVSAPQMGRRRERFNGGIPRYRSESHGWEIVSGDVVRNADYLAEDGAIERTDEVEFALVADKDQAAKLTAYSIANSRERFPISLELGLVWSGYKSGDCLTLNIPSALLFNQKCVVIGKSHDPSRNTVTLQFRTETDAKHPWALAASGTAPPATTVIIPPGTGDVGPTLTQAQLIDIINNSYPTGITFSVADTGAVTISNHTRNYSDKAPVAVTGTGGTPHAVSGAVAGDIVLVFYDDPNRAGGAVVYQHLRLPGGVGDDSSAYASTAHPYRHFVAAKAVPATGGTATGGSDVGGGGGVALPSPRYGAYQ